MKQFVLKCVQNELSGAEDNLIRLRQDIGSRIGENDQPYGLSGYTNEQVLERAEWSVKELKKAVLWVEQIDP